MGEPHLTHAVRMRSVAAAAFSACRHVRSRASSSISSASLFFASAITDDGTLGASSARAAPSPTSAIMCSSSEKSTASPNCPQSTCEYSTARG